MTADEDGYSQTWVNRVINSFLCRGDLANEKLEAAPVSLKELFRYASTLDKFRVFFGVLLSIVVGVMQPITCVVNGYISDIYLTVDPVDHIGNTKLRDRTLMWCGISIGVGVTIAILSYLQSYLLMKSCTNMIRKMRREFVNAVLHQDAEWFDATQAGDISSKLNDNVERIRDGLGDKIGLILRGFSMFIASAIFSFIINWRVTVICFFVGPLGAMTMGLMARFSAKPMGEQMEIGNEAAAIAEESVMNVKTVAACNGQNHMVKKYEAVLEKSKKVGARVYLVNGFFEGMMFFQMYIFYVGGLIFGVVSYHDLNQTNPGSILMSGGAILMGAYFLSLLGPHLMAILKARVAAAVIYKIIDRKSSAVQQSGTNITSCKGRIEFADVHFKYPTRETPILNGTSWTAEAGEMIAFVGHSGCGKSTSIGLITRLYSATRGLITIDGMPIESIDVKSLRKLIGIVSQEPCLFNGTIKENIILGRNISEQTVMEAAKTANAHDFIMKLEKGYDTVLGVGGVALSGGQKQRIAIARGIVTNPRILILDEATSALDSESERIVQLALNKASRGRTTIMIAHRLSTLKDVSRIHVMEGGVVTEIGSHLELLAKGGLYSKLALAQQVGLSEKPKHDEVKKETVSSRRNSANPFHEDVTRGLSIRSSLRSSNRSAIVNYHQPTIVSENKKTPEPAMESNKSPFLRMYFGTGRWTWQMYLTVIFAVLRGLEMPAFSFFQRFLYAALQAGEADYWNELGWAAGTFTFTGLWAWFFISSANGLGGISAETLANRVRVKTVKNLLHQDAAYFDQPDKSNAQCVTTIALQTPSVMACFDYRFLMLANNLTAIIACLVITYVSSWQIGLASTGLIFAFIILLFVVTVFINSAMGKKGEIDQTAEFAIEIFEQARTIQLLVAEDYFCKRYADYQDSATKLEGTLCVLQSLTFALTLSFVYFSDFLLYLVGAFAIFQGHTTSKDTFVAATAGNVAGWAVIFASPCFNELMNASAAATAIFNLIGSGNPEKENEGTKPAIEGSLNVEKVSFAYPTRPDTLVAKKLNLRAGRGQAIALVGASGCGKSTIIQLLERFYQPLDGNIFVDGNNIQSISMKYLRDNIALVGQEPVLFKGSIIENISLGCDNVSFEDVKKAAEMANAARFIETLPQGYDTDVGEKGRSLSGGQKQRIAIARALIRNPKVLLLDEATSALDTQSEEVVQKALNEASSGRTSITIAHRLSTIRKADRIYYIENGAVVEYGTHDELFEAEGKYAKLVEAQALQTS